MDKENLLPNFSTMEEGNAFRMGGEDNGIPYPQGNINIQDRLNSKLAGPLNIKLISIPAARQNQNHTINICRYRASYI